MAENTPHCGIWSVYCRLEALRERKTAHFRRADDGPSRGFPSCVIQLLVFVKIAMCAHDEDNAGSMKEMRPSVLMIQEDFLRLSLGLGAIAGGKLRACLSDPLLSLAFDFVF